MIKLLTRSILLLTFAVFAGSQVIEDCNCGEANLDDGRRVINGEQTSENKYPWMALMFTFTGVPSAGFTCGGSIISTRNILTAGHCVFHKKNRREMYWVLGKHKRGEDDGETYKISHYEYHPYYQPGSELQHDHFDMAMTKVNRRILFNENIKPICLPSRFTIDNHVGRQAIVAGWGTISREFFKFAEALVETKVEIKSSDECTARLAKYTIFDPDWMICAHGNDTDACQGDSGGPMFLSNDQNIHEVVGVVSFGFGCANWLPGVYADMNKFAIDWIRHYVRRSNGGVCADPRDAQMHQTSHQRRSRITKV